MEKFTKKSKESERKQKKNNFNYVQHKIYKVSSYIKLIYRNVGYKRNFTLLKLSSHGTVRAVHFFTDWGKDRSNINDAKIYNNKYRNTIIKITIYAYNNTILALFLLLWQLDILPESVEFCSQLEKICNILQ